MSQNNQQKTNTLQEAQNSVQAKAKEIRNDPTRPRYHALAPAFWMNDPNGPILFNNEIHVFYQYHPFGPKWNTMHWGHMKTKDLVHWENLPIAFRPSFEKGENHCFSGSCVVGPEGRATAIYTSIGNRPPEQWIAIASEDMLRWEKYENNPVMDMEMHEESGLVIQDWRDPYAWKSKDMYYCVIGGHIVDGKCPQGRNPSVFLYKSHDLRNWVFVNPLTSKFIRGKEVVHADDVNLAKNWECPNLFKLSATKDKWMLIVSPHDVIPYSVGSFEENVFKPKKWHILDYGRKFYAPNSLIDHKNRNIVIGWVKTHNEKNWNGCFSLPREITLNADQETVSALPIPEISQLRGPHLKIKGVDISAYSKASLLQIQDLGLLRKYLSEMSIELSIRINPINEEQTLPNFHIQLFEDEELIMEASMGYDREDARFYIGKNSGPFKLDQGESELEIHAYIDRSVLEIFLNNRFAITHSVNLKSKSKLSLDFLAEDDDVSIQCIEIWGMNPQGI